MKLVFIYGLPASGKLTIAKIVAARTGLALFHNHLIVDAVISVFPFGSSEFVRLREAFWMETFRTAAEQDKSLIFTFAPEPTVTADFPLRVKELIEAHHGKVIFVALSLTDKEIERRLANLDRADYRKLQSIDLFRQLRIAMDGCMKLMPMPKLTIDTGEIAANQAAERIIAAMAD